MKSWSLLGEPPRTPKETMMEAEYNHLNHATWECKYHVVFTPKYRKKLLFGKIKRHLGQVFHDLARRKECRIEEGHLMPDHVHMLISILPKYSVAQIIGYMKGKNSIWIAQNVERKMRNFLGHKFWARGYFVTTVGRDEEMIRAYIRNQELADQQLDQLELKISAAKIRSIVLISLKTAFGGSPSNLQLCWRLLAYRAHACELVCIRCRCESCIGSTPRPFSS
jgi:putative transposase